MVYPIAVAGGFTVTPGDGTAHLGLVAQRQRPAVLRLPRRRHAVQRRGRGRGAGVRGPQNAPRPGRPRARRRTGPGATRAPPPATTRRPAWCSAPDGRPLQFGGTGGQYRMAGDQSWKQLLLAGVTP